MRKHDDRLQAEPWAVLYLTARPQQSPQAQLVECRSASKNLRRVKLEAQAMHVALPTCYTTLKNCLVSPRREPVQCPKRRQGMAVDDNILDRNDPCPRGFWAGSSDGNLVVCSRWLIHSWGAQMATCGVKASARLRRQPSGAIPSMIKYLVQQQFEDCNAQK